MYEYGQFVDYKDATDKKFSGCDWYKSIALRGIYSAKLVREYVGKEYLGENISEIIQMSRDEKHLPDLYLEQFLLRQCCQVYQWKICTKCKQMVKNLKITLVNI